MSLRTFQRLAAAGCLAAGIFLVPSAAAASTLFSDDFGAKPLGSWTPSPLGLASHWSGAAGTAAAHAIQYPVGNETHTPHGMGVALLMPYVMEFNRPNCVAAFAQIGRAIGLTGTDEELSHRLIDEVAGLLKDIGIPVTLKELGLPEDKQDWTAESAINAARLVNNNPRKLDVDAMKAITRAAFSGDRAALAS